MTDFNLAENGETANPILMLIQEIETIMTAKALDIITDPNLFIDIDSYLFKQGVSSAQVAMTVQNMLNSGLTNPLGFGIDVACEFLGTQKSNDLLLIQTRISANNVEQTMVEYAVTKNLSLTNVSNLNNITATS